ncbi:DUF3310 domain-containing protein [Dyadobacter sp. CY261]|uniref:DUF3310 domain-containing protein n=1 Tax=Dyadobacter sp. CY261 TaxID=2907203 RepID=UPI001F218B4A|nr:DUF3310 domain-containing protein [Dyadobacter sp. CY261]MCF0075474.1 DUF3310 domain-containing protein [Dyadobacter sp. CY261]
MTEANNHMIGGTHYKDMAIEPWEIIEKNNLDFWEGSALSYLLRWRKKGGIADIDKAIHYLQKLKEINQPSLTLTIVSEKGFTKISE